MKQDLRRLSIEDKRDIQRKMKWLSRRRWLINHTPHVSACIGLVMLAPAIWLDQVPLWGLTFVLFTWFHITIEKLNQRRAHWVRPTHPHDTGPLSPR